MIANLYKWERFFKWAKWNYEFVDRKPNDDISCDLIIKGKSKNLALYVREYPRTREEGSVDRIIKITQKYNQKEWFIITFLLDFDNLPDGIEDKEYPRRPYIKSEKENPNNNSNRPLILNPLPEEIESIYLSEQIEEQTEERMLYGKDLLKAIPIGAVELSFVNPKYNLWDTGSLLLCQFQNHIFDVCIWRDSEFRMIGECILTGKHIIDEDFIGFHTINSMPVLFNLNMDISFKEEINDIIIL